MPYILEFEVPVLETDPNRTRGKHWSSTSSNNKKIKSMVHLLTLNKTPEKPLESFKISITRTGPRTLDWDNLIASFKGYVDALKASGIIKDDSWTYIRQINTDQRIGAVKKLTFKIEETV